MSVVIVGGQQCMVCQYKKVCKEMGCKAKVYTCPCSNLFSVIGTPDLIILFTNPVSHSMIQTAKRKATKHNIMFVQSHNAGLTSLKNILTSNVKRKLYGGS